MVLNYTTTIAAAKTVSEIQSLLGAHGAARITTEWANGSPSGVTFQLDTPHGSRAFTLPVDVDAMHRAIMRARDAGRARSISLATSRDRAHAERVAWRVVKDWLAAQLTLVESQMAQIDQVMLPYIHVDAIGTTLYDNYREHATLLELGPGSEGPS